MRRAVLAISLCAAPLLAAPADAAQDLQDLRSLRAVHVRSLPLRDAAQPGPSVARIATASGRARVLVGVRRHADLAGVGQELVRLGATPEPFDSIGVLAATVPDGDALAAELAGDPRVAYVEPDRKLHVAADPLDTVDPLTGIKYTWAYDAVRAGEALIAAGGGSRRTVAVMDTGLDVTHPEFAGRIARTYDTFSRGSDVTDAVGHGTFVTGLIAAVDGNGIGGKGVAGNTKVFAIRASQNADFTTRDLLRGIEFAIRRGADVLNMSLAGSQNTDTPTLARALALAFLNDVLPVAASGNTGSSGNQLQFPAAVLGGRSGAPGIGLSVGATKPDGQPADFSTHNRYVSVAAPGATDDCTTGVLSTLPAAGGTDWDPPFPLGTCPSRLVPQGAVRFAYGQGTSFAAPIVSGLAAVVWQVEPRLASEQVAQVLIRSAHQTRGRGWNQFTGAGIVDGKAATDLARTYDVTSPRAKGKASRHGARVSVRVSRVKDRSESGRELAGHVTYGLLVSRDGGKDYSLVVSGRHRAFHKALKLKGRKLNVFVATACDGNGNCGVKRLGRFRRPR
ncbi:MAG TPA: S8 family serine peptidase [Candidatus Limnocylindrales bacterium]